VRGYDLVALIFAREISDPLTSLVKTIDKQVGESAARRQGGNRFGVFLIFCSDDPGLQQKLEKLIASEGIKNIVVSISTNKSEGPRRYRISRDAELTAVVYKDRGTVTANFVLDSVDLTPGISNDILGALKKVLP
jgi:hypothetical protein